MKTMTARDYAKNAAKAQSNLNAWGAVVAMLEGGTLSGDDKTYSAQQQVIRIAQAEMQRHLTEYDRALARVVSRAA